MELASESRSYSRDCAPDGMAASHWRVRPVQGGTARPRTSRRSSRALAPGLPGRVPRRPDAAAAEDIAQEFLAAVRALGRFDGRRPLAPWLHTIVANRAIDLGPGSSAPP